MPIYPSEPEQSSPVPDTQEMILCSHPDFACETYVFEPSPGEEGLGFMFAAAETETRGGVGKELLDVVLSAVQNEYFRDPARSAVRSFELALHQANLILHDSAERGVRDWMGYFHVSVGALVGNTLHISVAGEAGVYLARRGSLTNIANGLSHSPITNPLRTFSQVASGEVKSQDTLFFTSSMFGSLFAPEDIGRFIIERSSASITNRMKQLYQDQKQQAPVAFVTVALAPALAGAAAPIAHRASPPIRRAGPPARRALQYGGHAGREGLESLIPGPGNGQALHTGGQALHTGGQALHTGGQALQHGGQALQPRKPLTIRRTAWQMFWAAVIGVGAFLWTSLTTYFWPAVKKGSTMIGGQALQYGGPAFATIRPRAHGRGEASAGRQALHTGGQAIGARVRGWGAAWWNMMKAMPFTILRGVVMLPTTSKIFAGVAMLLLIALVTSVVLLQSKRAEDRDVERASEILHDARTKKDAAETALIYDNREQARQLLAEAAASIEQLQVLGLYIGETAELEAQVQQQTDRLQKILRPQGESVKVVGSFAEVLGKKTPTALFFINNSFYTYNPDTNAVAAMNAAGETELVSQNTQEVGFFTGGAAHLADKSIIFTTNDGGVAIFDTKDKSIKKQEIVLPGNKGRIATLAPFGNRLYLYEPEARNIYSFAKTLRGYANGSPWITDESFPKDDITSIGLDGSIYTLHSTGVVRELFKGAAASDFSMEKLDPALSPGAQLMTNEDLKYLYIFDPGNKRVVILAKTGSLLRQVFLDEALTPAAMAVHPQETALYVMSSGEVLEISLTN